MFEKKKSTDELFAGLSQGEARAYSLIDEIIEQHKDEDPKAVLLAVKIICEYELMDNPYRRNVVLFKTKPKEL
jgi:hypothetical protein